jgi:hypothetical protein
MQFAMLCHGSALHNVRQSHLICGTTGTDTWKTGATDVLIREGGAFSREFFAEPKAVVMQV